MLCNMFMVGFASSVTMALRVVSIVQSMAQTQYKNVPVTSWMYFVCFWSCYGAVSSGAEDYIFYPHLGEHGGMADVEVYVFVGA